VRKITVGDRELVLSPDQDQAVDAVLAALSKPRTEAVLAGAAGSGKTTVLNAVLSEAKGLHVLFLAPTGKAALRVSQQTGEPCRTIHSAIYGTVDEDEESNILKFGELRPPKGVTSATLVVVDEASMVDTSLADNLRKMVFSVGGRILWCGDHEQLAPVSGEWGCDLQNPTAKLTQVHRQALDSPVLELATLIRQGRGGTFTNWGDECQRLRNQTVAMAVDWAEERRENEQMLYSFAGDEEPPSRVMLTWTNRIRAQANRLTRERRGYAAGTVEVGETLVCLLNNHDLGVMNGTLIEVKTVRRHTRLSAICQQDVLSINSKYWVIPGAFDVMDRDKSDTQIARKAWAPLWAPSRPKWAGQETASQLMARTGLTWGELRKLRDFTVRRMTVATYGYCLTVHKSQGSQWQEVAFLSCPSFRRNKDTAFKKRLTYTAVTRASERFLAFVLE
jgi:exodeoxyribonuclease-5